MDFSTQIKQQRQQLGLTQADVASQLFVTRPTLSIAIIHSSVGILLVQPANAISAAIKALPAPIAFRLTHGISTKPAMGSHTSPKRLEIAIDIACALCSGVPLAASTAAAAPIAEALPTSAWQPPWHQQYPHG